MWQRFAAVGVIGAAALGWWGLSPKVEVEAVSGDARSPGAEDTQQVGTPEPSGPQVEVVRFNPGGAGIIAGRVSMPGVVRVMLGGRELAQAQPDSDGQFAVFVTVPSSDAPQRLTLEQTGAAGEGSVIVAASAAAAEASAPDARSASQPGAGTASAEPVAALSTNADATSDGATPSDAGDGAAPTGDAVALARGAQTNAEPDGASTAEAPQVVAVVETGASAPTQPSLPKLRSISGGLAEADQPEALLTPDTPPVQDVSTAAPAGVAAAQTLAPQQVIAPAPPPAPVPQVTAKAPATAPAQAPTQAPVLVTDTAGVRVLDQSNAKPDVALDTISYDPTGQVGLSGRANATRVQIYLDNRPLTDAPVQASGDWRLALPQVDRGVYTLRVDAVDDSGAVVSRLETPFKREAPEDIARIMADQTAAPGFDLAVRTVQPGNTLWAIAQETYGAGILYVHVFEANADLIRDPDLIYPGQIFRLPELYE